DLRPLLQLGQFLARDRGRLHARTAEDDDRALDVMTQERAFWFHQLELQARRAHLIFVEELFVFEGNAVRRTRHDALDEPVALLGCFLVCELVFQWATTPAAFSPTDDPILCPSLEPTSWPTREPSGPPSIPPKLAPSPPPKLDPKLPAMFPAMPWAIAPIVLLGMLAII